MSAWFFFLFLSYFKKKKVHPPEHLKLSGLHWVGSKRQPSKQFTLQNY